MSNVSAPDVREWIRRIEEAIRDAQDGHSALTAPVLGVSGLTSPKIRHFLNNLCRGERVVYLEIGSWQGATITAASYRNLGRFTAVDNFNQGGRSEFQTNRQTYADWCRFEFIEGDCWRVPLEQIAACASVNAYFYDGAHDFDSQVKAFTHFDTLLAREFVAVLDDWDHPPVRKGTRVAFDALSYDVVREWELPARFNGDTENWWNGLYVAVVRRPVDGVDHRSSNAACSSRLLCLPDRHPDGGHTANSSSDDLVHLTGDTISSRGNSVRLEFRKPSISSALPAARGTAAVGTGLTAAIVIPCHNYGHWLAEAIESALRQTRAATEILVVDDSSSDDSSRVAAQFAAHSVRYHRIEAGSVWEARKAGYHATTAEVLCFLDADDRLAPDYLECGLPLFDSSRVGIVYSDFEQFGETTGRSDHAAYDRAMLERDNYIHAGSLVRRRAIEIARGFDAPRPNNSHADWFLWRRLGEAGFMATKQPALYFYRRHRSSMIIEAAKRRISHYEFADLRYQPVTIVSPLSGRTWAWGRYREWLKHQTWPRAQCSLLVIDSGPTPGVRDWLASCDYSDTRYLRFDPGETGLADRPRAANADAVRLAVSRIYNRAARLIGTPFAFILEDDVIPDHDVIDRLMRAMEKRAAAVSGAYQSRFVPGYVAWHKPGQHLLGGRGVEEIDGCGFGCLLIRRAAIESETFASLPDEHPDYDIAFFSRLRATGWKVKIDWDAKAEHLRGPANPGGEARFT